MQIQQLISNMQRGATHRDGWVRYGVDKTKTLTYHHEHEDFVIERIDVFTEVALVYLGQDITPVAIVSNVEFNVTVDFHNALNIVYLKKIVH